MANRLSESVQEDLRQLFMSTGSIKQVAKELGISKNTVKKLIRAEGLSKKPSVFASRSIVPETNGLVKQESPTPTNFQSIDFKMLNQILALLGSQIPTPILNCISSN